MFVLFLGENDEEEHKSEEEEVEMEVENDRVPAGKWHPLLETRQRELGYRWVGNDRVPAGKWLPLLETRQRELGYRWVGNSTNKSPWAIILVREPGMWKIHVIAYHNGMF